MTPSRNDIIWNISTVSWKLLTFPTRMLCFSSSMKYAENYEDLEGIVERLIGHCLHKFWSKNIGDSVAGVVRLKKRCRRIIHLNKGHRVKCCKTLEAMSFFMLTKDYGSAVGRLAATCLPKLKPPFDFVQSGFSLNTQTKSSLFYDIIFKNSIGFTIRIVSNCFNFKRCWSPETIQSDRLASAQFINMLSDGSSVIGATKKMSWNKIACSKI